MPDAISANSLQMQQAINSLSKMNMMRERLTTGQIPSTGGKSADLKNACAELESLFIFHLLKEMRSTIPKSGFLTGGRGEELYTSMFDAQIAREMASERGIGLSNLLMDRLGSTSGPEEKNGGRE